MKKNYSEIEIEIFYVEENVLLESLTTLGTRYVVNGTEETEGWIDNGL